MQRVCSRVAVLLALAGCGNDEPEAPTYYGAGGARAVIDQNCVSCHFEGGNTPMSLQTYDDVAAWAPAMAEAVRAGEMPPWQPDPTCRHYTGERLLPDAERQVLLAWADGGAAAGEDDGAPSTAPSPVTLTDFTATLTVPNYTPSLDGADDYRCFVFHDLAAAEATFVTGTEVVPATGPVHHVLAYAFGPDNMAAIQAADDADPLPGYTCVGSPIPAAEATASPLGIDLPTGFGSGGFPNQLAGWAPGSGAQLLPEGYAIRLEPESVVVVQVHYSELGGAAVPDASEVRVRTTAAPPTTLIKTSAVLVYDLAIAPGDPAATFTSETPYYADHALDLRSVAGHMHNLGTRIHSEVVPPGGADEACLLDIPDWDFHWQGAYAFTPEDPTRIESGSKIRLSCTYDNTADNQVVIDGVQQAPAEVTWGENSTDEMCLLYLSRAEPYVGEIPAGEPDCYRVEDCLAACDDYDCVSTCAAQDSTCGACVGAAVQTCAPTCMLTLATDLDCATNCLLGTALLGGNTRECLAAECPTLGAAFDGCLTDATASGACDEAFAACGISSP